MIQYTYIVKWLHSNDVYSVIPKLHCRLDSPGGAFKISIPKPHPIPIKSGHLGLGARLCTFKDLCVIQRATEIRNHCPTSSPVLLKACSLIALGKGYPSALWGSTSLVGSLALHCPPLRLLSTDKAVGAAPPHSRWIILMVL